MICLIFGGLLDYFACLDLLLFITVQQPSFEGLLNCDIFIDCGHESNPWHLWFFLFNQSAGYCFFFWTIPLLVLLILRLHMLIFFLGLIPHMIYVIKLSLLLHLPQFLLFFENSFELVAYFADGLHVAGKMHWGDGLFLQAFYLRIDGLFLCLAGLFKELSLHELLNGCMLIVECGVGIGVVLDWTCGWADHRGSVHRYLIE